MAEKAPKPIPQNYVISEERDGSLLIRDEAFRGEGELLSFPPRISVKGNEFTYRKHEALFDETGGVRRHTGELAVRYAPSL